MSEDKDDDKRIQKRVPADFVIEIYSANIGVLIGVAKLLNISITGACIESTSAMAKGDAVTMRFLLGGEHLISFLCTVKWAKENVRVREYGLKFESMNELNREIIRKFVQEYIEKPGF